jgi:Zn-dependent peptidase ImmA (M78 family)
LAHEVLERHQIGKVPVPVGQIALREGAQVRARVILPHGAFTSDPSGYVITIRDSLSQLKKRSVLGHEIGHLLLDRDYFHHAREHTCILAERGPRGALKLLDEEQFCDQFSSYLLMPDGTIADLCSWEAMTIPAIIDRADELHVSPLALAWRLIADAPYSGGFLVFRKSVKPTDHETKKLRLDWGRFPKERFYLPRYDAVPPASPIAQALHAIEMREEEREEARRRGQVPPPPIRELLLPRVKLNFGSLRGWRALLVGKIGHPEGFDVRGGALLAIVLPPQVATRYTRQLHLWPPDDEPTLWSGL